jgi:hemerythrin-like domain-containing protein
MLDILHKDHKNIVKLLNFLRETLVAIRDEQPVPYRTLNDALIYLSEVPDMYHHPREDMIYAYYSRYRSQQPTGENITSVLEQQHLQLVHDGESLREQVSMVLMDAVVPLDQMASNLESFVNLQQSHLDYEEGVVFPQLKQALTEDDWRNIEQSWNSKIEDDPLFGRTVAEQYQELAERLNLV